MGFKNKIGRTKKINPIKESIDAHGLMLDELKIERDDFHMDQVVKDFKGLSRSDIETMTTAQQRVLVWKILKKLVKASF